MDTLKAKLQRGGTSGECIKDLAICMCEEKGGRGGDLREGREEERGGRGEGGEGNAHPAKTKPSVF